MTMTTTIEALEATTDLHTELLRGTLETILGICEAGQAQEDQINEIASFMLDTDERVDDAMTALKLMNGALKALIEAQKGTLKRVQGLEDEIKALREQNSRLTVANIEIRQVMYGQMTLEEWDDQGRQDEVASKRDKPSRKPKKSTTTAFEEGSSEGTQN